MLLKKVSMVAVLALAPLSALTVSPRVAQACWGCTNTLPHRCISTGALGYATCTEDQITLQCHLSGDCIGF